MDPLANAYLKVINEASDDLQSKDQKVAGQSLKVGAAFGDSQSETTAKKIQPKSGPDADGAETPQNAQEAPSDLSVGKEEDGSVKQLEKSKTYGEASNPFDALFNKIISEEGSMMDFATSENPADSTFEPSLEDSDEFGESGEEGEGEDVTITIDKETAQTLIDVLQAAIGSEEESSEEDFGGEEMGGEESSEESSEEGAKPFGEAVEAEEEGHALVDAEKLNKGMNSKGNMVVKGAVPVTKKSAQTPSTGKGHDGKLKPHSPEGAVSSLTSKGSKDVGGVKVGKTLFDND